MGRTASAREHDASEQVPTRTCVWIMRVCCMHLSLPLSNLCTFKENTPRDARTGRREEVALLVVASGWASGCALYALGKFVTFMCACSYRVVLSVQGGSVLARAREAPEALLRELTRHCTWRRIEIYAATAA